MESEFRDDISLVEGCIKKEMRAWCAFVKKYSPLIKISVSKRLEMHGVKLYSQDIEDIRQDVLASIWKEDKLKTIRNRNDISYWLSIVSGNEAIAYLKKKRREEPQNIVSIFANIGERELSELIPSAGIGPKEESVRNELSERIEDAIESLPYKEKLIIKLNLLYGKRYFEIADIMNLPKGTVSSYLKRAKERLRKKLKDFS